MRLSLLICSFLCLLLVTPAIGQPKKKEKPIMTISRVVDGEIITAMNDTLIGKIKIEHAEDYYITSISYKGNGGKRKFTAYDVKWFRQVVPYPDREAFGVDMVFYRSSPHPTDKKKKVFLPTDK